MSSVGKNVYFSSLAPKIVSEYGQEIPQSQTADNPVAPLGRAAQNLCCVTVSSNPGVKVIFRKNDYRVFPQNHIKNM